MGRIAGGERDRIAWTLVLAGVALVATVTPVGLVTPRSRSLAGPESVPLERADPEPPPPRLEAPPPASASGLARDARTFEGAAAPRAEDAGAARSVAPASTEPRAELARLEIRVTQAGRPAPGARVELLHDAEERARVHACDATGRLAIALAPGAVRAVAWSDEACALPVRAQLAPEGHARIELALEPALPVAGRVLDASSGQPLAGARVALWTFAEHDAVVTGPDGCFRHPRFPAGAPAQQLVARAEGYGQTVRYLRVAADGGWKLSAATAGEASVKGDGLPWVELWLVPELVVRGRVLDARGLPAAGARVAAEGFFHALPSVASRDGAETRCDAEGRFELAGLRSDIGHSLLVEAAGHAHELRELPAGTRALDLGEIALVPEAVLAGVAIDGNGLPLAGVEVVLRASSPAAVALAGASDAGARLQGRELRAVTGPEGTFLFEHLASAPVRLSLDHTSGAHATLELFPRPDGSFEAPCLVLTPPAVARAGN